MHVVIVRASGLALGEKFPNAYDPTNGNGQRQVAHLLVVPRLEAGLLADEVDHVTGDVAKIAQVRSHPKRVAERGANAEDRSSDCGDLPDCRCACVAVPAALGGGLRDGAA